MKRITKIAVAVGAALTLGLGAAAVSAQPYGYGMGPGMMGSYSQGYGPGYGMGPGMMGGYGPGYGMGWGGGHMGGYGPGYGMGPQAMFNAYSGNADEGVAALKSELGITTKQDSAWQAFTKTPSSRIKTGRPGSQKCRKRAAQALRRKRSRSKRRHQAGEMKLFRPKNLYATLTPEQKAIADQRFGGFGRGYGAGYGRGSRGGPGAGSR